MDIFNAFPSKFLKAADLQGQRVVVYIKSVEMEDLGDDRRPVIYFHKKDKGLVLNKTNATEIADRYGPQTEGWINQPIELYAARVEFQGKKMEGLRVNAFIQPQQPQQPAAPAHYQPHPQTQAPQPPQMPHYAPPPPQMHPANPPPPPADHQAPIQQQPGRFEKKFDLDDEIPF